MRRPGRLRRLTALAIAAVLALGLTACGGRSEDETDAPPPVEDAEQDGGTEQTGQEDAPSDGGETEEYAFQVGLCTWGELEHLDRVVNGFRKRLKEIGQERGTSFRVVCYDCQGDPEALSQILAGFQEDGVDLMAGLTAPVAEAMAGLGADIPMLFAAVQDPVGMGLAASREVPGGSLTGTTDAVNPTVLLNLLFASKPGVTKVGLLYDDSWPASRTAVDAAIQYLQDRGIETVERTGTNPDEAVMAARALVEDGVKAVFTPNDLTMAAAESAVAPVFLEAGIPHFGGMETFAADGAFLGYGVDYAALGRLTADMAAEILLDGADTASTRIRTASYAATVNTAVCGALGWDYETVKAALFPLCGEVRAFTPEPAEPTEAVEPAEP